MTSAELIYIRRHSVLEDQIPHNALRVLQLSRYKEHMDLQDGRGTHGPLGYKMKTWTFWIEEEDMKLQEKPHQYAWNQHPSA